MKRLLWLFAVVAAFSCKRAVDVPVDGCQNACGPSEVCRDGRCVCQPQCDGRHCGPDGCGQTCGTCVGDGFCDEATGQCACTPESNAALCQRLGRECGVSTAQDNCGTARAVDCGQCTAPRTCEAALSLCACEGESDADLCQANNRECGTLTTIDRCGDTRTIANCGGCDEGDLCNASGLCELCVGEVDAALCATASFDCGSTNLTDRCGASRPIESCGQCEQPTYCLNNHCYLPPPPETCEDATDLVWDQSGSHAVAADDTSRAANDYQGACSTATTPLSGKDVVYRFTLSSPASVTAKVTRVAQEGTRYRPAVSIRRSCDTPDAELACALDIWTGDTPNEVATSTVTVSLRDGSYYVVVDGVAGSAGPFTLDVTLGAFVPGDDCGSPTVLTLDPGTGSATAQADLVNFTGSGDSTCSAPSGKDAVYAFTIGTEKMVAVTLAPTSTALQPLVYIRSRCVDPAVEAACAYQRNTTPAQLGPQRLRAGTWFVWVDAYADRWGTYEGPFTVTITATDPVNPLPAHDICAGVVGLTLDTLTGSARVSGDTRDAFDDYAGTCAAVRTPMSGPDVVYSVVLPAPARLVAAVTRDSSTPNYLPALYVRGDCASGALTDEAACNVAADASTPLASLAVDLAAGTWYLVVDGQNGSAGRYTLDVATRTAANIPDTCGAAEPIALDSSGFVEVVGDTSRGTNGSTGSCSGGTATGNDLVYSFSTNAVKDVSIVVIPSGNLNPAVYVRSVCDETSSQEGCQYASSHAPVSLTLTNLVEGVHFIVVDGANGASGPFLMRVQATHPSALPANDVCGGATPITLPSSGGPALTLTGSTAPVLDDYSGGCANASALFDGPDLVYSFTVLASTRVTATVTPDVGSPNFQPAVYIRSTCATVGADACAASSSASDAVTLNASLSPGAYYLIVDGVSRSAGAFELSLTQNTSTYVAGGSCTSAIALDTLFQPATGGGVVANITGDSTQSPTPDWAECAYPGGGLVYSFTLSAESLVDITVGPSGLSTFHSGFYLRRTCADPATQLYCVYAFDVVPRSARLTRLEAGTYYLVIGSDSPMPGDNGLFTATVAVTPMPPLPANDSCAGAQAIALPPSGDPPTVVTGTTATATNTSMTGGCGTGSERLNGADVVYSFSTLTATQVTARVTAATNSGNYWPAVYIRQTCGSADSDLCKYDATPGFPAELVASLPAGAYYLVVDGVAGSAGDFQLELSQLSSAYVAGDNCFNARSLDATFVPGPNGSRTASFADNTQNALNDGDSSCTWPAGRDLVYSFTVSVESTVEVSVTPDGLDSSFITGFHVRKTCASQMTELYCDLSWSTHTPLSATLVHVAPGTYYLWIDTRSTDPSSNGPFLGAVTIAPEPAVPANDTCAGAQALSFTGGVATVTSETSYANDDGTGRCARWTGSGPDVVYTFTTTSAQKLVATVTRDATTPGYMPLLYVRDGCGSTASVQEIACANESSGVATVTVNSLTAGTYYVWVDGTQYRDMHISRKFTLEVTLSAPVTGAFANDYCAGAQLLGFTRDVATATGDTTTALDDTLNQCAGGVNGPDLVYRFELTSTRKLTAEVTGTLFMPALEIRRTCGGLGPTDVVGCSWSYPPSPTNSFTIPALGPGTYYAWVDAGTWDTSENKGAFTLTLTLGTAAGQPPNDTCAGAIPLTLGVPVRGTTVNAANDYLETLDPSLSPVCWWMAAGGSTPGPDVVYSYTPGRSGFFTVSLMPSGLFDGMLWVTEGTCGTGPACVAIANNPDPTITATDAATAEGVAGTTYYIGVDSYSVNLDSPQRAGAFTIVVH